MTTLSASLMSRLTMLKPALTLCTAKRLPLLTAQHGMYTVLRLPSERSRLLAKRLSPLTPLRPGSVLVTPWPLGPQALHLGRCLGEDRADPTDLIRVQA